MAPRRYSLILVSALLTAAAATFAVYRVLEAARADSKVAMRHVVVAAHDLPEGAALGRTDLSAEEWPSAAVPEGAFASVDSVVGRVTRIAIFRGEAMVPGRLAPNGTGPGLQVKITPGKRAMAVEIDDVAGVSGLIQPNSRVDVLVTLREHQGEDRQVAKLFMENMRVLAVGTVVTSGPDNRAINATTATLEVTPEESERLAVAMREGTIQLVLRGYGDPETVVTRGARSSDVLSQLRVAQPIVRDTVVVARPAVRRRVVAPAPPAPTVAPPPPQPIVEPALVKPDSHQVQVYRAEKLNTQKFEKVDTTKKKPERP